MQSRGGSFLLGPHCHSIIPPPLVTTSHGYSVASAPLPKRHFMGRSAAGISHNGSKRGGGQPHPDSDPRPRNQKHKAHKPKKPSSKEGEDIDNTGSSLVESVHIESASSSDSDSSEEEERGNHQKVPTGKKAAVLIGGTPTLDPPPGPVQGWGANRPTPRSRSPSLDWSAPNSARPRLSIAENRGPKPAANQALARSLAKPPEPQF